MIDAWNQVCPVARVCQSPTEKVVVAALEEASRNFDLPRAIHVDAGFPFTTTELCLWAHSNGITLVNSVPRNPKDNPFLKSLTASFGPLRHMYSRFMNLDDACRKIENCHQEYNEQRTMARSEIGTTRQPG